MNGNGTFNPQILVDKLAKLNNSQQSIETLSHWCIFHRKKAKQVVETWDQQFHHSPRDQRLSFLYLANDILQNSRRKGAEFVAEFWRVLPHALNDVIKNGDDFGRKAALRLVDIWEDRKVFGSRGHVLKDELLGRNSENRNSSGTSGGYKLKQPAGHLLEKIISRYEHVYDGHIDEDALFGRCRSAISFVEKMEEEMGKDFTLGNIKGSGMIEELQGKNSILKECVGQLKIAESSRTALQSHLREALHEQELKIEQVRKQLQVVLSRYEQTSSICQQFQSINALRAPDQKPIEASLPISDASLAFSLDPSVNAGDNKKESASIKYSQQQQAPPVAGGSPHTEEDQRKNTAAEVAAKLTASTSSAQMLSYVLSSLASEGIIGGQSMKEEYPSDSKRPKIENGVPPYIPAPAQSQPPPPPFPHLDLVSSSLPPPLPSMPLAAPLMPPATAPQFMQPPGPMMAVPYNYGSSPLQLPVPPLPSYPMVGMPPYLGTPNPFQSLQSPEGVGSFSQPPPLPATPPPRQ